MKAVHTETNRMSKKKKIYIGTTVVVVTLVVWWAFVNFAPKPLGNDLEYLGKENLGGGLLFSDHRPYSVYYYGTDMEPTELARSFHGANYAPLENFAIKHARFTTPTGDFMFTYLDDHDKKSISYRSTKAHIVSLSDSDYTVAKSYIDN